MSAGVKPRPRSSRNGIRNDDASMLMWAMPFEKMPLAKRGSRSIPSSRSGCGTRSSTQTNAARISAATRCIETW